MSDPERLSRGDDFQAGLLQSARDDRPGGVARRRAAMAVGLSAALGAEGVAGAAGAAASVGGKAMVTLSMTKLVGLGVLVFGLGGAAVAVGHAQRAVVVTVPAPPSSAGPAPRLDIPPPEPVVPTVPEPAPVVASAPVHVAPPPARRPGGEPLTAQLALLAEARQALARGDTNAAAAALSTYRQAHPSGPLQAEADLLRVELLLARGDRPQARALAQRLLDDAPSGPHARRLRSLLGTLE